MTKAALPEPVKSGSRVFSAVAAPLYEWIKAGAPYPPDASARLRQYAWSRRFFGMNLGFQRRLVPAPPLEQAPVFILGLWRSGTTFLHELLATHPAFCTPRTWQCVAPSSFGLTGRPRTTMAVRRPMDDFVIDADSPQEDEFALLMLGAPSVYRGFIDPARLPELTHLLSPASWAAPWSAEADWIDFLARVHALDGGERRLLLKSPNHSFRISGLRARFPHAPCVWITRHPADTLMSNLTMWRRMIAVYGLRDAPSGALGQFMVKAARHAADNLSTLCATLPRQQLVVLDLACLRQNPAEVCAELLSRWGVPTDAAAADAMRAASLRHQDHRAADHLAPPAWADRVLAALGEAQTAAEASHGL